MDRAYLGKHQLAKAVPRGGVAEKCPVAHIVGFVVPNCSSSSCGAPAPADAASPHLGHTPDSLFGIRRDVGREARLTAEVGRPWFDSAERFRHGALAVPLDVNLGLEVARGEGLSKSSLTTSELSIDFTGLGPRAGDRISVEGGVLSAAADGALSSSRAYGADGRLLAMATAWIRYVPSSPEHGASTARDPDALPAPQRAFDDLFRGCITRTDSEVRLAVELPSFVGNARRSLQGGVCAALGEWLGAELIGRPWRVRSLRAQFLRPTPIEAAVTVSVSVLRRGRTYALVDAVVGTEAARCCLLRLSYTPSERGGEVLDLSTRGY